MIGLPVTKLETGMSGVREVYLERFREAANNLRVEVRMATPDWARHVLNTANGRNRKLSNAWVKLKNAIARGAWQVVDVIVFDRDGNLIDGQHRLTAIAASGEFVPVIVLYGVSPDAFAVLDTGKKRCGGDVLSIEGYEYNNALAAALAWVWRHESGEFAKCAGDSLPNDQLLFVLNGHPEIITSVRWAVSVESKLISPALLAFLHYVLTDKNPKDAERFFEKVVHGIGVEKASHEFLLRRRLESMVGHRRVRDQVEIAALVIKTWSRIRLGEEVGTILKWRNDEPFPAIV